MNVVQYYFAVMNKRWEKGFSKTNLILYKCLPNFFSSEKVYSEYSQHLYSHYSYRGLYKDHYFFVYATLIRILMGEKIWTLKYLFWHPDFLTTHWKTYLQEIITNEKCKYIFEKVKKLWPLKKITKELEIEPDKSDSMNKVGKFVKVFWI